MRHKHRSFVRQTASDTWLFARLVWYALLRALTPMLYIAGTYRLYKGW